MLLTECFQFLFSNALRHKNKNRKENHKQQFFFRGSQNGLWMCTSTCNDCIIAEKKMFFLQEKKMLLFKHNFSFHVYVSIKQMQQQHQQKKTRWNGTHQHTYNLKHMHTKSNCRWMKEKKKLRLRLIFIRIYSISATSRCKKRVGLLLLENALNARINSRIAVVMKMFSVLSHSNRSPMASVYEF